LLHLPGVALRVLGADSDERLVPSEHLYDRSGLRSQGRHDLCGCGGVRGSVDGKDDRIRHLAGGDAQRHPRPDAELASLV
jgi:hypothetical protein